MKILDSALRLLFPPKCLACSELVGHYSKYPYCEKCYRELVSSKVCGTSEIKVSEHIDEVYLLYSYNNDSVKYSVFHAKKCFSKPFAKLYSDTCKELFLANDFINGIDLITFATRRSSERRREGLDQACQMAKIISQITGIPYKKTLKRKRRSRMQRMLSHEEREQNVKNLFDAVCSLDGLSVLLTDDVTTTGATLSDCARALKLAGAKRVTAVVFAG